jgi:hypothetical protein
VREPGGLVLVASGGGLDVDDETHDIYRTYALH